MRAEPQSRKANRLRIRPRANGFLSQVGSYAPCLAGNSSSRRISTEEGSDSKSLDVVCGRCLSSTRTHRPMEWKREIAFSALSLALSTQAERDNESCFFLGGAAGPLLISATRYGRLLYKVSATRLMLLYECYKCPVCRVVCRGSVDFFPLLQHRPDVAKTFSFSTTIIALWSSKDVFIPNRGASALSPPRRPDEDQGLVTAVVASATIVSGTDCLTCGTGRAT
ncbi:hypothetical protein EVAR_54759_1 [Eumeta japonica]|uniref:Uncharacterized protein n=1 Tax=Eumeta variegata TaxID=151549 RepID=A0A4C1YFZ8_EUMVA|nr:hypothetical protein EVAR_54759_1 [Eumeta japonica]